METLNKNYKIIQQKPSEIHYKFGIVIIGNSDVGKSSLIQALKKESISKKKNETKGFDFCDIYVQIEKKKIVSLTIYDTSGNENNRNLLLKLYKKSSLGIIMYAINNHSSFKDVDFWMNHLKTHASPDCKAILIGGKSDLKTEREVTYEEGQQCRLNHQCELFKETSIVSRLNVDELFIKIALILYSKEASSTNNLIYTIASNEDKSPICCII